MRLRLRAVVLAILLPLHSIAAVAQSEGIVYTVRATIGGGTAAMRVDQDALLATTSSSDGALVAGLKPGSPVLRWEDDLGLLAPPVDIPEAITPGMLFASPFGGLGQVDSARVTESQPSQERRVAGHRATRTVIRADLWWHHLGQDGVITAVHSTGDADWWSSPDLPYSPLAVAGTAAGQMAALPLAGQHLEMALALYRRIAARLADRGMLLRATVVDSLQVDPDAPLGGSDEQREVRVDAIMAAAEVTTARWNNLPTTSRAVLNAFRYAQLVATEDCGRALAAARGASELTAGDWRAEGGARFTVPDADDTTITIMAGTVTEDALACGHLVVRGTPSTARALEVGLSSRGAPVVAMLLSGSPTAFRVVLIEDGEFRLETRGVSTITGTLTGTGPAITVMKDSPTILTDDVRVRIHFRAETLQDAP